MFYKILHDLFDLEMPTCITPAIRSTRVLNLLSHQHKLILKNLTFFTRFLCRLITLLLASYPQKCNFGIDIVLCSIFLCSKNYIASSDRSKEGGAFPKQCYFYRATLPYSPCHCKLKCDPV